MALQNWTLEQIIDQLKTEHKWDVGPGGTITWGTPSSANYYKDESWYFDNSEINGLEKLNNVQIKVAEQALRFWSDVANIKFEFSASTTTKPDITFQNSTAMGDAYAWAYFPTDATNSMKGSIWFNSNRDYRYSSELQNPSLTDIEQGGWAFMAFVHEIGHALGLEHMGDYDASEGRRLTYANDASCVQDSMLYSIMSYFTPWESKQADWQASDDEYYVAQTPMMNDIAAIQRIYGVNTTTRTTDTVYGFNASAGLDSVYNFNINQHPVLCLFDSGGIDTLDLSGFRDNSNVNLLAGSFSSCDQMTNNISIARNVLIENATTGDGDDRISGNAADNRLDGGEGNDRLFGLAGNDTLIGGKGNDTMTGGAGNDTYHIDSTGDRVIETANGGTDTLIYVDTDSLHLGVVITLGSHVENLELTGYQQRTAKGNSLANKLTGNNGENWLHGEAGNDSIFGGQGEDRLYGGTGNDELEGGEDADDLSGDSGNDRLFGGVGWDSLYGGTGNDRLDGGKDGDTLYGGTGNDIYVIDYGSDKAIEFAGQGIDTVEAWVDITLLSANIENIILRGSAEKATGNELNNSITGNAEHNELFGGSGNDQLDGGFGNDKMDGGSGNDLYFVDSAGDLILELAAGGIDTVESTVSITQEIIGTEIENIILKGTAKTATGNDLNNTITGNGEHNELFGGAGNDTLSGGSGNDTLNGGTGNDIMRGGAGDDIYVIDSIRDRVVETARGGIDTLKSTISVTLALHIENAILEGNSALNATGNAGSNQLTGNEAANVLNGGAGNDAIYGGLGNDTLIGGSGADQLFGGAGDDVYDLDNAGDRITENLDGGIDLVLSSATVTSLMIGEHIENIRLTGTAAISATGNGGKNEITGNAAANTLNGEAGDDMLNGGAGHDRLFGGTGNDTLNGGTGNDLLDGGAGADTLYGGTGNDVFVFDDENDKAFEDAGQGTDTVEAWVDVTLLSANIENIILRGSAEKATGNELANRITGNAGDNVLDGGLGRDTLTGGAGKDIFSFSTALGSANIDTIRDFSVIDDTIQLDGSIFAGISGDFFARGTRALDADDRIFYNASTGGLFYDKDGNGAEAAIQFATLSKNLALTAADFVII